MIIGLAKQHFKGDNMYLKVVSKPPHTKRDKKKTRSLKQPQNTDVFVNILFYLKVEKFKCDTINTQTEPGRHKNATLNKNHVLTKTKRLDGKVNTV